MTGATGAIGVAFPTSVNLIYVANNLDDNVSVIDGNTNTVIATVTVGDGPVAASVNPITNQIYVTNQFSNNVSVVDGLSNTVIAAISVGAFPTAVGVNLLTNRIYVANFGDDTVSVIDGNSNIVIATVTVGIRPFSVGSLRPRFAKSLSRGSGSCARTAASLIIYLFQTRFLSYECAFCFGRLTLPDW